MNKWLPEMVLSVVIILGGIACANSVTMLPDGTFNVTNDAGTVSHMAFTQIEAQVIATNTQQQRDSVKYLSDQEAFLSIVTLLAQANQEMNQTGNGSSNG